MLQVTFNESDRILLDMADCAEQAERYDQHKVGNGCGTPACMLGTYAWLHPESKAYGLLHGTSSIRSLEEELQITDKEFWGLFGAYGCGAAGNDGKAAAEYVREFVRKRALARISA